MRQSLFRQEAVDYSKQSLHGDILLFPNPSHTLVLGILLFWFSLVIFWLFVSHFARKETVTGWLEPPLGLVRLYPESSGTIQRILVSEGDFVEQNQSLMIIKTEAVLGNGQQIASELLLEYESQKKLVEDQVVHARAIFENKRRDIDNRISAAKQEYDMYNDQIEDREAHSRLVASQVQRLKKLRADGYVSNVDFDNAVGQELSLKIEQKNLFRNKISQRNLIEQLQTEQRLLPDQFANELAQLKGKLSDVSQQMTQVQGQSVRVIKATRAGTVNNLQAREGQHVSIGGNVPLLTLIPSDSTLVAHLLVPVSSAGFLAKDQLINIRYDAFPYQKFGLYEGRLEEASKTVLLPNELSNAPISVREPVYRVTARLDRSTVQAYGKDFSLKPGMTLSADISLDDRNLVQWMLEPIFSLKGRI